MSSAQTLGHRFEGKQLENPKSKTNLVNTALHYLNSPYLWGGKSPFGIDCSGFVQCVYQLHGIQLPRDAYLQAEHGETLGLLMKAKQVTWHFLMMKKAKSRMWA